MEDLRRSTTSSRRRAARTGGRRSARLAAAIVAAAIVTALSLPPGGAYAGGSSALFGPPHCVVAISAPTGFVSLAPPSAEGSNDVVSLVLRPLPELSPGDLVRLDRPEGASQPAVSVLEASSPRCARLLPDILAEG